MLAKENRDYIYKGIVDFCIRCLRNWFPVLVVLGVFAPMAGLVGHGLGLPHLFRDDGQLWEYKFAPYVKSSLIWGHAAATLLILALWSGIFLQDELSPENPQQAGAEPIFSFSEFKHYLLINSWPFFLLLPIAAISNTDIENKNTDRFTDALKSMVGCGLGLLIAFLGVVVVRFLLIKVSIHRKNRGSNRSVLTSIPLVSSILNRIVLSVQDKESVGVRYWLRVFVYALLLLVITGIFTIYPVVLPAVGIHILLVWIVGTYFVFSAIAPAWRAGIVIILGVLIYFAGSQPYPNRFADFQDGSQDAYNDALVLENAPHSNAGLIVAKDSLNNWKAHLAAIQSNGGAVCQSAGSRTAAETTSDTTFKPPLVIITASGGAYRSGFWVSKVLDQLLDRNGPSRKLDGLFNHVRLLTGASGGMVGSAYLAASAPDPCALGSNWSRGVEQSLRDDIVRSRDATLHEEKDIPGDFKTWYPLDRDGLGPIAQQIFQRDIPRYFLTPVAGLVGLQDVLVRWENWKDRGWVLEQQWGRLTASFADFKPGEQAGWRPSLIFSPMIVETGRPLIISNLNSSHLTEVNKNPTGLATQLFSWFPYMQDQLKIRTAVRMNASFPYVSPAVSLPTKPARRVVDAGYYDNHGVSIAATWIQEPQIWNWIRSNTNGVIFIQIRAFSSEDEIEAEHRNTAFQWLISPLSGVLSARSNGSRARNEQIIENLQGRIDSQEIEETGAKSNHRKFVHSVVFENRANSIDGSMSWYLPEHELCDMNDQFAETHNQEALKDLINIWKELSPSTRSGNRATNRTVIKPRCPQRQVKRSGKHAFSDANR